MPKIHDLSHLEPIQAYDETQTNEDIKSGDFLILSWGVAVLEQAWPVVIEVKFGLSAPDDFHAYQDYSEQQHKKEEFHALKTKLNWHPTLTPHDIAIALITLTMTQTGALDAYDLDSDKLLEAFENWKASNPYGMGDDVMMALKRLGFELEG
jgi:hypothetical protein